jgi:hypothetical protein
MLEMRQAPLRKRNAPVEYPLSPVVNPKINQDEFVSALDELVGVWKSSRRLLCKKDYK